MTLAAGALGGIRFSNRAGAVLTLGPLRTGGGRGSQRTDPARDVASTPVHHGRAASSTIRARAVSPVRIELDRVNTSNRGRLPSRSINGAATAQGLIVPHRRP